MKPLKIITFLCILQLITNMIGCGSDTTKDSDVSKKGTSLDNRKSNATAVAVKDNKNIFIAEQNIGIYKYKMKNNKLADGSFLSLDGTLEPQNKTEMKLEALTLSKNKKFLYVLSSPEKNRDKYIYRINLDNKKCIKWITLRCKHGDEKLEGLALIDDNFYVGRKRDEKGNAVCTIYKVPMENYNKIVELNKIKKLELSKQINSRAKEYLGKKTLGLSSLEYQRGKKKKKDKILLLTSNESDKNCGIFWTIKKSAFVKAFKKNTLNKKSLTKVRVFPRHKPDGIDNVSNSKYIIICDDYNNKKSIQIFNFVK